jgi:mevalonate kinase
MSTLDFFSQGKLLLTGEYVVLDGASAIALPCKLGQLLKVENIPQPKFEWTSYLKGGKLWQKTIFSLKDIINQNSKNSFEKRLFEILKVIYLQKPQLFESRYAFTTHLDFEKEWGLGSSSTLINNLSQWAQIDPYFLLEHTFGGSGYDIAAASKKSPFIYTRHEGNIQTQVVEIHEKLKPHLYFVYLNQKQNSRDGIAKYRQKHKNIKAVSEISFISKELVKIKDIKGFEKLLQSHESIISEILEVEPIHSRLFSDYDSGIVKSLGAWGGDFVLVTAEQQNDLKYFEEKGYKVVFNYKALVC